MECSNPFLIGRINNAMIQGFNNAINMPKMVVIVIENDIINDLKDKDPTTKHEYYGRFLEYIIKTFQETSEKFRKLLPVAAQRPGWPKLIFITPTLHRFYKDYDARVKFIETLNIVAAQYANVWAVKLLQVWDENNTSIYLKYEQRYTGDGLNILWRAVDRSISFCNRKIIREDGKSDSELIRAAKEENEGSADNKENNNTNNTRKIFWNRENNSGTSYDRDNRSYRRNDLRFKLPHPSGFRRN